MATLEPSIEHPISSIQQTRPLIIPIFIPHAGCPNRCVFCNQSSITGVDSAQPAIRIREQVEKFLKYKDARRNFVQIAFFGGNFLGIDDHEMKRLLAEAAEFVKAGRADSIRFSTRPDTVDSRRLSIVGEFPVATIELGAQSMNDQVLSATQRGHTASDTEKAIQRLKAFNYEIGVQLMVGLPGDSPARLRASARRVARLKPDFVRIYPTVVLAGSRLANWYKSGRYQPLSLKKAVTEVKDIYRIFKAENIGIIRMGLQANEDLKKDSTILAGPYHAAFGHLVYSAIFLDMAMAALNGRNTTGGTVAFHVHPHSVSKMRGLANENINVVREKFKFKCVNVIPDASLGREELQIY